MCVSTGAGVWAGVCEWVVNMSARVCARVDVCECEWGCEYVRVASGVIVSAGACVCA